ncbi:hypothetical protein K438DRAFT_1988336 [Mycena galopus ATCC 62051]|nr:hypothetical protein K438DRAFT_1988336 [Mycena galopus ATCC 62051]
MVHVLPLLRASRAPIASLYRPSPLPPSFLPSLPYPYPISSPFLSPPPFSLAPFSPLNCLDTMLTLLLPVPAFYAEPWIFPPLAFYGADLPPRILRWRVAVRRVEGKEGGMEGGGEGGRDVACMLYILLHLSSVLALSTTTR